MCINININNNNIIIIIMCNKLMIMTNENNGQ